MQYNKYNTMQRENNIKHTPGVCTILSEDPMQPERSSTYFCSACLSLAVNAEHSLIALISLEILLTMKNGLIQGASEVDYIRWGY